MDKLFTIGFSQKKASEFFNLLIENKIDWVIDIRLNPNSQLSGFAKNRDLPFFLEEIGGIRYKHVIELAPTKELLDVIIDDNYNLSRKGQADYSQIEKLVEQKEFIFHNTDKKIPADKLNQIPEREQYSLILIKPINPVIHVRTWEDGNKKITCSFEYNKKHYHYFSVTDHKILDHYLIKNDGNYSLKGNLLFVISLGELYDRDSCHYKLIASVLFDPASLA